MYGGPGMWVPNENTAWYQFRDRSDLIFGQADTVSFSFSFGYGDTGLTGDSESKVTSKGAVTAINEYTNHSVLLDGTVEINVATFTDGVSYDFESIDDEFPTGTIIATESENYQGFPSTGPASFNNVTTISLATLVASAPVSSTPGRSQESILEEYRDRTIQRERFQEALANETDPNLQTYYQDLINEQDNILNDLTTEASAAGIPQSTLTQIDNEAPQAAADDPIEIETFDDGGSTVWAGAGGAGLGFLQGAANTANVVTDGILSIPNIPSILANGMTWMQYESIGLDGDGEEANSKKMPYLVSPPDWSRDLFVNETDSQHATDKGVASLGLTLLGLSKGLRGPKPPVNGNSGELFPILYGVGADANKLRNTLAKLGNQASVSKGKQAATLLKKMAKKAGLTVQPGGKHLGVFDSNGNPITNSPHSPHSKGTIKGIAEDIMAAAGF